MPSSPFYFVSSQNISQDLHYIFVKRKMGWVSQIIFSHNVWVVWISWFSLIIKIIILKCFYFLFLQLYLFYVKFFDDLKQKCDIYCDKKAEAQEIHKVTSIFSTAL